MRSRPWRASFKPLPFQHANEDVEKMILGNKCDMTDKRVVNKERGEAVRELVALLAFALCVD